MREMGAKALLALLALATCGAHGQELRHADLRLIERSDLRGLRKMLRDDPQMVNGTSYREGRCSAISYAAQLGHADVVALLARRGADLEARCHEDGFTPLMLACTCSLQHELNHLVCPQHLHTETPDIDSHAEVVRTLVAHGARVDAADTAHGRTALHFAAMNGNAEILRDLLNTGASPEVEDGYGWTPLFYAVQRNDVECVRSLASHGAKLDRVDSMGSTPLIQASNFCFSQLIDELLDLGANPGRADATHRTAADYVASCQDPDSARKLSRALDDLERSAML